MKPILALIAVLTLATPAVSQPPTIINKTYHQIVQLSAVMPQGGNTFCTGVVVGITRVLTAEHCVTDETFVNGAPARVVKKNGWLVLLDVPLQQSIIDIAKVEPVDGDEATTIGFVDSDGTRLTLKRHVAGFGTVTANKFMFLDGPLVQGMSGGPVINAKGELIGINQMTNPFTGAVSTLKEIRAFLK